MAKTPRPATEWIFDDLGRMKFAVAYDFTSAEFDQRDVGIVFAFTEAPGEPEDGEKRFQIMLPRDLAGALHAALTDHLANLRG